jgi:mono/diheme cytochrome c family protein
MHMKKKLVLLGIFLVIAVLTYSLVNRNPLTIPEDIRAAMQQLPEKLDYNIHVKRILSDKCFSCHGPDSKKQKGDLRLDEAKAAYAKEAESGRYAIVPGRISKSEIAHRILSDDVGYVMPTPSSHLSLTTEEKAVLLKWIDQGAVYKPHWAFVAPQRPALPNVKQQEWPENDIDYFVLNRLEQEGLKPSPTADKATLIRRVSFDLTGLPPTISAIDSFLQDNSADSYEKMVDRYLQSPRYGERMAAYWLDVARFADSHGYLDDKHRDASPWRDWVIQAYNKNLPFDQFITWQLAGDLLPNATREQILATGFNRNQKQNSEAGILPEEFRVEYNVDRTNTVGTALMGLTVSCAKCHDHKYDPISHADYFSLYAFFNNTFELGSANYGADYNIVPGPTLLLPTPRQETSLQTLTSYLKSLPATTEAPQAVQPVNSLSQKAIAAIDFDKLEKRTTQAGNKLTSTLSFANAVQPQLAAPALLAKQVNGVAGKALELDEETLVNLPAYQVGDFERYEPFAFSLWLKVPSKFEESAILHHSDPRRYGFQGYDLVLKNNRLNFRLMHAYPHDAISVLSTAAIDSNGWYHIAVSYDGSSSAKGVKLFVNGKPMGVEIEYDNLKKNIRPFLNMHKVVPFTGVSFGARSLEKTMKGGQIDAFYLFNDVLNDAEAAYLYAHPALVLPVKKTVSQPARDSVYYYRKQLAQVYDSIQETMVMGDIPMPRKTHILLRGVYDSYGDEVNARTPAAVLPYPAGYPKNRLGLSQWLFLPENPLTGRVAVNHLWELFFGNGLVKTSDDFGNQGELPSHPELLDYLSILYREKGWDTKAIQKFILMSATYRQSSVITPELHAIDPENRLLARSSRYKMSAEMIRDQVLSISGLLSPKVGGPSVFPYQPEGLWEALSDKSWRYRYVFSTGEDLFRRSIYTVVKRSSPPPFMLIFDAPDRNFCTVKRSSSSSPLQALVMMNDPTFIESAKFIADRMMLEGGHTLKDQLTLGFRLITGRNPLASEDKLLQDMYTTEWDIFKADPAKANRLLAVGNAPWTKSKDLVKTAAYVNVIMALINTDEFITRK